MPEQQSITRFPRLSRQAAKELDDLEPIGFNASFHGEGQDPEKRAELVRQAQIMYDEGGGAPRVPLLYMDPLLDPLLFLYPKGDSRVALKQINVRLRHYYETHRLIGNIIDLHSEFPLSDFKLRTPDPDITKFYNEFKEKIGLLSHMVCWLRDYWLLGETFVYGTWDKENLIWSGFNQYPPESVEVKSTYIGNESICLLYPDDDPELKKICNGNDEINIAIRNSLPPAFVESVKRGEPIILDNSCLIHFARKPNNYSRRGVSIVRRAIKDLMYEDKLRCLQLTFVDRHMFPIKVFKLGDRTLGWIPSQKHFRQFRILLAQAANDPDFNIIYHFGVEIDYVGTKDKIANLIPEFDFVERSILTALFANDTVVHGDMSTYAGQAISMRVLLNRYLTIRSQLETVIKNKIFLPLAKERGFKDETGEWILPEYVWEKTNLLSNTTQQEFVMRLRDKHEVPMDLVCDIFGWDKNTLAEQLKAELGTVFDPRWQKIYEDKLGNPNIADQVFKGKGPDDWEEESVEEKKLKEKELEIEKIPTAEEETERIETPALERRLETEEPAFLGGEEIT